MKKNLKERKGRKRDSDDTDINTQRRETENEELCIHRDIHRWKYVNGYIDKILSTRMGKDNQTPSQPL